MGISAGAKIQLAVRSTHLFWNAKLTAETLGLLLAGVFCSPHAGMLVRKDIAALMVFKQVG
jgi:hypothetical protein